MERSNKVQNVLIVLLVVAVFAMSVGFATYSTNLVIRGTANFAAAKWDIHFNGYTAAANSVNNAIDPVLSTDNKTISFDVDLNPGEFYEFDVNAVNEGTFNAKLQSVTITPTLASTVGSGYYTFECTYNGTSCSDASILGSTLAKTTGTAAIHVKVAYPILPQENVSQYPPTDTEVTYSITFNYVDADAYENAAS